MKPVNTTELGVAVTPVIPEDDWNSLHQARSSHCSWEPAAQWILFTAWLWEGSRAAESLWQGAVTELFLQYLQLMPIAYLSSARPVLTLPSGQVDNVCAFLLRKLAANRTSKSLISGLDSKSHGLPGQRRGAGKCGHVWELWAQGLECAGRQSTGPVGAFGRVKNAGLEHEGCALK